MRPEPFRKELTVFTSCSVSRPDRNVYLLTPVIASDAAGPEMKRRQKALVLKGKSRGVLAYAGGEPVLFLANPKTRIATLFI